MRIPRHMAMTVRARSGAGLTVDADKYPDIDSLSRRISELGLTQNNPSAFDKRVTLGAWLVSIKVKEVALRDSISIMGSKNHLPLPPQESFRTWWTRTHGDQS